jgi:hypothetical protein
VRKYIPLCNRCEHRARFHESGKGPRYECSQTQQAVDSCYMYEPVTPVVLKRNPGDRRPTLVGWLFSARCHAVGLAACSLRIAQRATGTVLWKEPIPQKPHKPKV